MARLFASDGRGNAKLFYGPSLSICWAKLFAYEERRGFKYARVIEWDH